ncbi:6-aminohexanoate hydrolase [Neorhizobium sp. SOG26]|uniref:serine hydrolase domain-containing protein n=1 Tax=Neorhizobium sp. SOG26 TaxID=2060726 RepID=UPI000E583228|nr:serine hydrolase [Neorhizobium sp. SOG26]AXV17329.1 6-aminohexanoate hydrolase [Neorhizobium sp. SOG26]
MRSMKRILKLAAGVAAVALVAGVTWLYVAPPELLRVGSGYAAKIVCSNVFLANRDSQEVLEVDVQAPGHPLLRLMRVSVDEDEKTVHAAILGVIGGNDAVYREGLGCSVTPDERTTALPHLAVNDEVAVDGNTLWPEGAAIEPDARLTEQLADPALVGPGMRAVVVVKGGRIIAEAYAPGFSKDTPLLGWSMTKTVTASIIGTLVRDGRMSLEDTSLFPQWRNDQRAEITVANLLAMESGLVFNEGYGSVADVTRMLFLEPDMAAYAADQPLEADPGTRFNYSSGTAVLLSKIWMDRIGNRVSALAYPHLALFGPLGMTSAVMETDAAGTFTGSSYMYATARDWAKFGLFLARDGVWNGNRILPENFVRLMHEPNGSSNGRYSKMQTWLPGGGDGIPPDTFVLDGHDGQSVVVIPSLDVVVVRLGLTPRTLGYKLAGLIEAAAKAGTAP